LRLCRERYADRGRDRCNGKYPVPHDLLLRDDARRPMPACIPTQFMLRGIVPIKMQLRVRQFSAFSRRSGNPLKRQASPIVEPRQRLKCRSRFDFPSASFRRHSMIITAAHIPAIVALVAGILILLMPRLLNLVVAIYLICIGLIGLGLLKWLHM